MSERLKKALAEVGEHAHGVGAIEIWVLDDEEEILIRPENGFWLKPGVVDKSNILADQLYDPITLPNSSNIAGALFTSKTSKKESYSSKLHSSNVLEVAHSKQLLFVEGQIGVQSVENPEKKEAPTICFRPIQSLRVINDARPKKDHLALLNKANLSLAAAVPFESGGWHQREGVVIYYASNSNTEGNVKYLNSVPNHLYMILSTEHIGNMFSRTDVDLGVVKQSWTKTRGRRIGALANKKFPRCAMIDTSYDQESVPIVQEKGVPKVKPKKVLETKEENDLFTPKTNGKFGSKFELERMRDPITQSKGHYMEQVHAPEDYKYNKESHNHIVHATFEKKFDAKAA